MLVVNLFGAPGAGKSTLALLVASVLKTEHADLTTECPDEIAKLFVYEESHKALGCQLYIAGRQQWQIARCEGHADIVVCDGPVLLSTVYAGEDGKKVPPGFDQVCEFYHNQFPSSNWLVKRRHAFESRARIHGEEDEPRLHKKITEVMDSVIRNYNGTYSSPAQARIIANRAASLARSLKE